MNKPVLLVVDDDAQVLAAVRRDLRSRYRESYTVISAASGEEALATVRELKARGESLAMILTDQRMPGVQGTEVLVQARDVYPVARRVPSLACTVRCWCFCGASDAVLIPSNFAGCSWVRWCFLR